LIWSFVRTAERTVGLARTIIGELDHADPELENKIGAKRTFPKAQSIKEERYGGLRCKLKIGNLPAVT
jgi:hypothetical protein